VGKFGLPEAWIAFALLCIVFAEYLGAFIAKRFLRPRKSATQKIGAPYRAPPETGP
jgi:hypothetical protein